MFTGDGNFILEPPASERSMLKLLTKEDEFSENFSQMVLRFTDSTTYDEIKAGGTSKAASGCDAGLLKESQHTTRHKFKTNLESRILEDLLSPEPGESVRRFSSTWQELQRAGTPHHRPT